MNILFIGDVFSKTGRRMLREVMPKVQQKYHIELTIVNGENATHGKGLIKKQYDEILGYGVDFITMGNHTYSKKEIFDYIDEADHLIVPYNQPRALPGVGSRVISRNGKNIRVTNLLGLAFMDPKAANPFEVMDDLLEKDKSDIHIVDFHAEATAEKIALGFYLDGRVTAVLGTHTHVATNDERLLPKGTAFMCDVGMTGPYNSVIGCAVDPIIERNLKGIMTPFSVAEDEGQLRGVVLEINNETNKCEKITVIRIDPDHPFEEDA